MARISAPFVAWQKARAPKFSARPLPQQKLNNRILNINDRETRRYDMFGRVQTFGKDSASDFAAIAMSTPTWNPTTRKASPAPPPWTASSKTGMAEVTQLDAIMHNKYARNPDKLLAWKSASHIERAPKREKKSAGGTTPPKPTP